MFNNVRFVYHVQKKTYNGLILNISKVIGFVHIMFAVSIYSFIKCVSFMSANKLAYVPPFVFIMVSDILYIRDSK